MPAATSRRSFVGKLLGGTLLAGGGIVVSAICAYLFPPQGFSSRVRPLRVKVGSITDIPLGKGKLALIDGDPVWVIHVARGFVGVSAICTHKGCIIGWEEKRRVFSCPCHEGHFDVHGNVISGLPRRPLSPYQVGAVHGDLYVAPRRTL